MVIQFACNDDIEHWMCLLELVKDSFPGLDEIEYKRSLKATIANKEALIAKKDHKIIGALAFSKSEQELCFLAVHPHYRRLGIAKRLIEKMISLFPAGTELKVITYQENDAQGVAARNFYQSIGFVCAEKLTVFDYPCQKMTYIVK